ncbi:MAG TPA: hypothetical protein VGV18_11685, partial [Verrucomicrobiae bacterium]|nr:hypothetical protein [Verrucomicrobiae bacterium]
MTGRPRMHSRASQQSRDRLPAIGWNLFESSLFEGTSGGDARRRARGAHAPRVLGGRPRATSSLAGPAAADEGAVPRLRMRGAGQFRLVTRVALLLSATAMLLAAPGLGAQQFPITGSANDFNSVEYYGAPHQQDIKRLFSGAEAQPLPGGLLLVKKAKIEMFDLNGKLRIVAEAPDCIYDPVNY